ncbi:prefoldin subunit 5 [Daktulosphaira vitifoliae]|uniref:prefoldin subunit 5 n=1 Tax=Daktulosphaira vitifoliae TaxID=58002 RepID=UPI0021AAF776|nr:prefoldin subunit 5 [Daktulosphaira vitifoliae]
MAQPQLIDLKKLNVQQLAKMKEQMYKEVSLIQDSLQSLKIAQKRYLSSQEALESTKGRPTGTSLMIPLTKSMYAAGQLADPEYVTVCIGAGYYLRLEIDDAIQYFKRRVNFLVEQMESIQQIGIEKQKLQNVITEVLEIKLQQAQTENK